MQTFHYTSIKNAVNILNGNSFYAAKITELPEKQKEFYAFQPTLDHLEKLSSENKINNLAKLCEKILVQSKEDLYEISFCKNGNSEYMWKNYAGEGCCISFDKNILLSSFANNGRRILQKAFIDCQYVKDDIIEKNTSNEVNSVLHENDAFNSKHTHVFPIKSYKDLEMSDKELSEQIEEIDFDDAVDKFLLIPSSIKLDGTDYYFSMEEEERLIFIGDKNSNIRNVEGRSYLVLDLDSNLFVSSIKQIQLNPNMNKEQLYDRLKAGLKQDKIDLLNKVL